MRGEHGITWHTDEHGATWGTDEFGITWYTDENGATWGTDEFGATWHSSEHAISWHTDEYGATWGTDEFGHTWYSDENGRIWRHGESGVKYVGGEHGITWVTDENQERVAVDEYGVTWHVDENGKIFGSDEYGTTWYPSEYGITWYTDEHGKTYGTDSYGMMWDENGKTWREDEYGAKYMGGEHGITWATDEHGKSWGSDEYGITWQSDENGDIWGTDEFGTTWYPTEYGITWHTDENGKTWGTDEFGVTWHTDENGVTWGSDEYGKTWYVHENGKTYQTDEFGYTWQSDEHAAIWFIGEFASTWWSDEFGKSWLEDENGIGWSSEEFGISWYADENGETWMSDEHGRKWFKDEFGDGWWNTEFGATWYNSEHGNTWWSTEFGTTWWSDNFGDYNDFSLPPLARKGEGFSIVRGDFNMFFLESDTTSPVVYAGEAPSSLDYVNALLLTGCPGGLDVPRDWKLGSPFIEMYMLCEANKNGSPTEEQQNQCCGYNSTCTPVKCEQQSSYQNNRYVATFQKTGCPRPFDNSVAWATMPDGGLSDMMTICMQNKLGNATTYQSDACCGSGKTCSPVCTLQKKLNGSTKRPFVAGLEKKSFNDGYSGFTDNLLDNGNLVPAGTQDCDSPNLECIFDDWSLIGSGTHGCICKPSDYYTDSTQNFLFLEPTKYIEQELIGIKQVIDGQSCVIKASLGHNSHSSSGIVRIQLEDSNSTIYSSDVVIDELTPFDSWASYQTELFTVPSSSIAPFFLRISSLSTQVHIGNVDLRCTKEFGSLLNVALEKTVTSANQYGDFYSRDYVTDGVSDDALKYYHSSFPSTVQAWLEIDLGDEYSISHFNIYNRLSCCQYKIQNFVVIFKDKDGITTGTYSHSDWNNEILLEYAMEISTPLVAKTVRLEKPIDPNPSDNVLHIQEFQVYGVTKETNNIALGKQASASGVYESRFAPSLATDGLFGRINMFHSPYPSYEPTWLEIDLAAEFYISGFKIFNRAEVQWKIKDFIVVFLNHDREVAATFSHADWENLILSEYEIEFSPFRARYARIEKPVDPVPADNVLHIQEFEIYQSSHSSIHLSDGTTKTSSKKEYDSLVAGMFATASDNEIGNVDGKDWKFLSSRIQSEDWGIRKLKYEPFMPTSTGWSVSTELLSCEVVEVYSPEGPVDIALSLCSARTYFSRNSGFNALFYSNNTKITCEIHYCEKGFPRLASTSLVATSYVLKESNFFKYVVDDEKFSILDCPNSQSLQSISSLNQCADLASRVSGFSYNPALEICVIQKCEDGVYKTAPSTYGWLSYVGAGFFPVELHGYKMLPLSKRGRVGCTGEYDEQVHSLVASVESCINIAFDNSKTTMNYKVSNGECSVLSCDDSTEVTWEDSKDDDVYVYMNFIVDSFLASEKLVPSLLGELHSDFAYYDATLSFSKGTGKRPKNKFDLIFGNSSYAVYDIWLMQGGSVDVSVTLTTHDFIYLFVGESMDQFESNKISLTSLGSTMETYVSSWDLASGLNRIYITQGEEQVDVYDIEIVSGDAFFHKEKNFPLLFSDWVTINSDFSMGENRGKELVFLEKDSNVTGRLISLGKKVSVASEWAGYVSHFVTDGIVLTTDIGFLYHSAHYVEDDSNKQQWVEIDFEDEFLVTSFEIYNRIYFQEKLDGFLVTFKDKTGLITGTFSHSLWNNVTSSEYKLTLDAPIQARYARLEKPFNPSNLEDNYLHLREFKIFGDDQVYHLDCANKKHSPSFSSSQIVHHDRFVSLGKKASVASEWAGLSSIFLTDGITSTGMSVLYHSAYHSLEESNQQQWVEIDLGNEYMVSSFEIYNRIDFQEKLDGFLVIFKDKTGLITGTFSHSLWNNVTSSEYKLTLDAPIRARYARLEKPFTPSNLEDNYLHLREFKIFGDDPVNTYSSFQILHNAFQSTAVNVALAKPVTVGNQHDPDKFLPVNVNDGITYIDHTRSNYYHSDYPSLIDQWLEIDLVEEHLITSFKIFNRMDCCSIKIKNFSVVFKDRNGQVTGNFSHSYWNDTILVEYEMTLASPIRAQYARIEKPLDLDDWTMNALHIQEFEIYGSRLLSLGKSVDAVSVWQGYGPESVTDGNVDDGNMYHSTHFSSEYNNQQQWVEIDLEDEYMVSDFKIYNRKHIEWKLDNFLVTFKDSTGLVTGTFSHSLWDNVTALEYEMKIDIPIRARYAKLEKPYEDAANNYLHIREFEVFGNKQKKEDCVRWFDDISLASQTEDGITVATHDVDHQSMSFKSMTASDTSSQRFNLLPPNGLFPRATDCVYPSDRFSIGVRDSNLQRVLFLQPDFTLGPLQTSLQTFGAIKRQRTLQCGDHVTINALQSSILYASDNRENPILKWDDIDNLFHQRLTTYRVMTAARLNTGDSCVMWNDAISLEMSHTTSIAHVDGQGYIYFTDTIEATWARFRIVSPGGLRKSDGCVHFGEDFYLQTDVGAVLTLNPDNSFVRVTNSSLDGSVLSFGALTTSKTPVSVNARKALYKNTGPSNNLLRNGGFDKDGSWTVNGLSFEVIDNVTSLVLPHGAGEFSQYLWFNGSALVSFKGGERCSFGASFFSTSDKATFSIEFVDKDEDIIHAYYKKSVDTVNVWSEYLHSMIMPPSTNGPFTLRVTKEDDEAIMFDGIRLLCNNA